MDSDDEIRATQMPLNQPFIQSSNVTSQRTPSPRAHLPQAPSILPNHHPHNMNRTLASIHREEGTYLSASESVTKSPSRKEFENMEANRSLEILKEISTIIGGKWLRLRYEDEESFFYAIEIFASISAYE